ncbi:MAG: hypothetical protein ABSE81_07605 [Candidatus Omnitrophota bacterium]|jgi:hypothetical protein
MKKIAILMILAFLFVFTVNGFAAANKPAAGLTNLQFANILMQKMHLTLPAGSDKLAPSDYYNALANALAENRISQFLNTKANDPFTCAGLINVLYTMVGGRGKLSAKEKADYLVKNGYIKTCPANLNGQVSEQFVNETFNNSKLLGTTVENYMAPPGLAGGDRNPGGSAPGVAHENVKHQPASPI